MASAGGPRTAIGTELWTVRLGVVDYDEALALQHDVRAARAAGRVPDVLLLLEHPPVYTRGRRSDDAELPLGDDWYARQRIAIRHVDRGGKTTYHGPGQLVAYPIVDTAIVGRDVPRFVGLIEGAIIESLRQEGVTATRDDAGRGVWAQTRPLPAKIGSIGLHVAGGVTTHGLAVNVDCDLAPFGWIKPCGLETPVTSIAAVTGRSGRLPCFSKRVAFELARGLGLRQRLVSRARLESAITSPSAGRWNGPVSDPLALTAAR